MEKWPFNYWNQSTLFISAKCWLVLPDAAGEIFIQHKSARKKVWFQLYLCESRPQSIEDKCNTLPPLILWYAYMQLQPIINYIFHCFCLFYNSFMNYSDYLFLVSTVFGLEIDWLPHKCASSLFSTRGKNGADLNSHGTTSVLGRFAMMETGAYSVNIDFRAFKPLCQTSTV